MTRTTDTTLTAEAQERINCEVAGHDVVSAYLYDFYRTERRSVEVYCMTCRREVAHYEIEDEPSTGVVCSGGCAVVYEPIDDPDGVPIPAAKISADGDVGVFS